MDVVDGFTVEGRDETVVVTFSDRYGHTETYVMTPTDAARIGLNLVASALNILVQGS